MDGRCRGSGLQRCGASGACARGLALSLHISADLGKCHITMSGPSVVYVTVNVRKIFAARFARGP